MNVVQSFKMAMKSILGSKMRSFLTMLGIIIGVASVIVLISLINGMTEDITSSFESMGTNTLTVNVMDRGGNREYSISDLEDLVESNQDYFKEYSPYLTSSATVKYGTSSIDTTVQGVGEIYPEIRSAEVDYGRFIQYIDCETYQNICIIGTYQVEELYGGSNPIGTQLKLNGVNFTVVGVLSEAGDSTEGSADDLIYIPYTTIKSLTGSANINSFIVSTVDVEEETIDMAKALIENSLSTKFGSDEGYMVISMAEMISSINEMTATMATVLVGIAGISLAVGGIGIMNIMLVSVTERTREIGIRKSLGAKRKVIMQQFIIEAAVTGGMGGVIGIILGIGVSFLAGEIMGMTVSPTMYSIVLAFSVSVAIGMIFGYFPANKAAKLNPIDALRHD